MKNVFRKERDGSCTLDLSLKACVLFQGTTLRLALLPGASSTVKNRFSGKFMA